MVLKLFRVPWSPCFLMQMIDVDTTTLITLVTGICVGGNIDCRLRKQAIRMAMICCFALIILLISHEMPWSPVGGNLNLLSGRRL